MKTSSSAVKILTVSIFATMIVLFICYRVGVFDNDSISETYSEVNQSNFESNSLNAIDTPVVNKDSIVMESETMSSSKSMVVFRQQLKTSKEDSAKKAATPQAQLDKQTLPKISPMSSSKSAVIFTPKPSNDTSKKPK